MLGYRRRNPSSIRVNGLGRREPDSKPEGPPGAWDDHGATFASVIYDSACWSVPDVLSRFFVHGGASDWACDERGRDELDEVCGEPDRHAWPGAWDGQSVRVPMVWKEGPTNYRMILTGSGSGGLQVGYATSTIGIHWTKSPSDPVFNDPTWAHGATENWGVMKVGVSI